ncbi:MAG TPA: 2-oxoacid:acceptor oxidoreductase family protein, partial [Prolixibacteraceae bacterium]|nr:2-oxoacid:acceptor oxidoreductase family protein [Prolixibacteraceae bacterium]
MKTDIILAGVGGQGILSIAATLGAAAVEKGLYLKQAETHGMSQRGGAVVSHLRIADYPVASDLIPLGSADLILSVEPMESLRYLPFLSAKGCLVSNVVV